MSIINNLLGAEYLLVLNKNLYPLKYDIKTMSFAYAQANAIEKTPGKNRLSNKPTEKNDASANNPFKNIVHPQKTMGNQGIQRLINLNTARAKLQTSQPYDACELEADYLAEKLSQPHDSQAPEENGFKFDNQYTFVKRGSTQDRELIPTNDDTQSLSKSSRSYFESRLGWNLSQVRIHTDERAEKSAEALCADAYTVGTDIFFGKGKYDSNTVTGKRLLAHELVHVLQSARHATLNSILPSPVLQVNGSRILRQKTPTGGNAASPPQWLSGVSGQITHMQGNIYEINLSTYGPTLVGPYTELDAYLSTLPGPRQHAHHIVGGEHLQDLGNTGFTYANAPCVALEEGIHSVITSYIAERQAQELGGRRTAKYERPEVTSQDIASFYQDVYSFRMEFNELVIIAKNIVGVSASKANVTSAISPPLPPISSPAEKSEIKKAQPTSEAAKIVEKSPKTATTPTDKAQISSVNKEFIIEPVGGGAMILYSLLINTLFRRVEEAARAELECKMPQIEAHLMEGQYVAVIENVEVPKNRDILSDVTGIIEAKDIPVYKDLIIQTAQTEGLAINPPAMIKPMKHDVKPIPYLPQETNRVINPYLYALFRPYPEQQKIKHANMEIRGTYEQDESSRRLEISYNDKDTLKISAWDLSGDPYVVNDLRWDKNKGIIEVAFYKPSTDYTIRSKFVIINSGQLIENYAAGHSPNLLAHGTLYWYCSTAALMGTLNKRV